MRCSSEVSPGHPALNWRRIINPVAVFTVIGIVIGLAGVNNAIPGFLVLDLNLIGAMAIPLFMLILGGNIYNDFTGTRERKVYTGEVIKFALIKNILFPLVFLGLLIWVRPDFPVALIIILQAAIPPITAIPIFTEREGGNRALTSQFIVATFVLSAVSIPVVLHVFGLFFPFPPGALVTDRLSNDGLV